MPEPAESPHVFKEAALRRFEHNIALSHTHIQSQEAIIQLLNHRGNTKAVQQAKEILETMVRHLNIQTDFAARLQAEVDE